MATGHNPSVEEALAFLSDVEFGTSAGGQDLHVIAAEQFRLLAGEAGGASVGAVELTSAELLDWCLQHELLRVVSSDITTLMLPGQAAGQGASVWLHDVKVSPPRRVRGKAVRGPLTDDAVYAEHADIRERVPRGLAFLHVCPAAELVPKVGKEGQHVGVQAPATAGEVTLLVRGLRKFTGKEDGDDDDTLPEAGQAGSQASEEWRRYFTADPDSATHVANMEKANGESGHLGVVRAPASLLAAAEACGAACPPLLIVGGSKSVHAVLREPRDLQHEVYTAPRYDYARPILGTCLDILHAAGDKRQVFMDFMSTLHLTMCVEFLNPDTQHVERFDFTHPQVQTLTFVSGRATQPPSLALGLHPIVAVCTAKHFGFDSVASSLRPISELPAVLHDTRHEYGKEGSVLYYIDAGGSVISLVKRKSVWYILQRAVREKVRGMGSKLLGLHEAGWRLSGLAAAGTSLDEVKEAAKDFVREWRGLKSREKRSRGAWNKHVQGAAEGAGLKADVARAILGGLVVEAAGATAPTPAAAEGALPPTGAEDARVVQWLASVGVSMEAQPAGPTSGKGRRRRRGRRGKGGGAQQAGGAGSEGGVDLEALQGMVRQDVADGVAMETRHTLFRMGLRMLDIQDWLALHPETVLAHARVCLGFIKAVGATEPRRGAPSTAAAEGGAAGDSAFHRTQVWLQEGWDGEQLAHRFPQVMQVWLAASGVSDNIVPRTVDA